MPDLRQLLAARLMQGGGRPSGNPLSSAQQRLWFLDQLEPNSPIYNIPSVGRLKGRLDVDALRNAINVIAKRHEALRTRFSNEDGEPCQVVDEEEITIGMEDLSGISEPEREQVMNRKVQEEIRRPFNLSTEQLIRINLLRLAPEDHVLIINIHHIISDEWSLKIFFKEFIELYTGYVEGRNVSLPDLPIQYSDYAMWQRDWLKSEECQKQLEFWKEQLKGNPPGVDLPTDFPRQANNGSSGAVVFHPIGTDLSNRLKGLAQNKGVTMFMLLLAAYKTLLHRYTHQQDVIVGSPMAGRNRMETEEMIGFFVNTLPLRTRVAPDMTFEELVMQVREVALAAYCHQDVPFDKLVEALQPERSLRGTPFIKVMFIYQNDMDRVTLPGLEIEFLPAVTDTAKFDLTLWILDGGHDEGLLTGIEYNTSLFERSTIERFLQHYECLLHGIVSQPAERISDLPLLSEAERRHAVAEWVPPATEFPEGVCVHQWFEAMVDRFPENVAVTCGEKSFSYRELNDQANRLAHYLKARGVGPEVPVALHLERSLMMLVGILGVLKAGGAYVPMDPSCPAERIQFMLEDTKALVILSQENLRGRLPELSATIVCLDSEWTTISAERADNPVNEASGDNVAYIIYTSGSTGKPKGVLVTHHNVARLLKQTEHWYHFNDEDVWTLFHSYTFDFSVWEIWGALLYGGRLVVVPYLVSRSPAEFYELLAREKVTVLNQTPSAFRQLIWAEETAPERMPLSLRYVIFGGEALELQSLKPWFDRHGDEKPLLVNMYGITETTVHVTFRIIKQADLTSGVGSVIGVPIPDLRICLLDEKLQPVPTGVPGEICVAGAGVARGYLNRPELTTQRFISDPWSNQPGLRLYRSGDLARYTAKGELEYLGRMDHQVKVRGFRVELGEIESALNSHPAIRESIVIAADGPGGSKRLIAYIVPTGNAPTLAEIRQHLLTKIPEYMVPAAFVPMEALPLTSNGKVDRRALPAADLQQTVSGQAHVAPRNPTETTLMDIWCQLLRRDSISIHENFFHLGGHSLLATQAIWRIAGTFQIELPVKVIFEAPTIAELAEAVSRAQPSQRTVIKRRRQETDGDEIMSRLSQLSDGDLKKILQTSKD